jgi:hypothetical protein
MTRAAVFLASIIALPMYGVAFAQDASDESNENYEKLKVLEPLVGTYYTKFADEELGKWETKTTISWLDSKSILKEEVTNRIFDSDGELETQDWSDPVMNYFVWNNVTKRIEKITLMPWNGGCQISAVDIIGDGAYKHSLVRTTRNPSGWGELTARVTEKGIEVSVRKWIGEDGEPMPDVDLFMKRVADD